MKILVTGANGFLGSHLVQKSIEKGHETVAAVRVGADLSNLSHLTGFELVEFDFGNQERIQKSLKKAGPCDLIIHNAGLTKSYSLEKYLKVNVELTSNLILAIKATKALNEDGRFAYISSLAARGPVGNKGPASNYGISKLKAEEVIQSSDLKYMIYRPAGIYGSRDVQFVPLVKAVQFGFYPFMTTSDHKMALINARDVAENVIECSINHTNQVVHLDDGKVYHHDDVKEILETLLSTKSRKLKIPKGVVRSILYLSDLVDKTFNRTPKLSLEHYDEISQDWNYDYTEERKRIPLKIEYSLLEGFREAGF